MKSYTSLEQIKKLTEILPFKSADMVLLHEEPYETSDSKFDGLHQALCVPYNQYDKSWRQKYRNISYFPCWSLAALLEVIYYPILIQEYDGKWSCIEFQEGEEVGGHETPIDACVAMILKLHERKLL